MQGKRVLLGLIALSIGLAALYVYFQHRVPEGIEPMSDSENTIVWISLTTAVVSLVAAVVSLATAVIEMLAKRN